MLNLSNLISYKKRAVVWNLDPLGLTIANILKMEVEGQDGWMLFILRGIHMSAFMQRGKSQKVVENSTVKFSLE